MFKWTVKHQARLAELVRTGKSDGVIAKVFGCSSSAVSGRRRRTGLYTTLAPSQPKPLPPTIQPLSPAMRHLAQFDSVLAARLELENKQ